MTRSFESGSARREATYLAFAIVGFSGSGKTKSALRIADGMRRVKPGPTFVVDSNLRRSLHHADVHDFHVVHLTPPFDPDSWANAFQHCIDNGAVRIIVDSFSDEHEGDGGVLEWHEAEIVRMSGGDANKALKVSRAAWKAPKDAHKRLRLWMWQQSIDWILCYRAKDKQDAAQKPLGMQPIGGADVIFDLLFSVLLPPKGDGKPVWTAYDGNALTHAEKQLVKSTAWFDPMFAANPQLNEDVGESLARWAAGGEASPKQRDPHPLVARFDACGSRKAFDALDKEMRAAWSTIQAIDRVAINEAYDRAVARGKAALAKSGKTAPSSSEPTPEERAEIERMEAKEP